MQSKQNVLIELLYKQIDEANEQLAKAKEVHRGNKILARQNKQFSDTISALKQELSQQVTASSKKRPQEGSP